MADDQAPEAAADEPAVTPPEQARDAPATGSVPRMPDVPVVGIGASAGGLAALEAFFAALPSETDPGMAFIVVQHLDPTHKSMLLDLVQRYTRMKVSHIEDGIVVQPRHIYIIPPNRDLALLGGKLHLLEPVVPRGLRLPIDGFFRSLALDQRERAIGIILSGTGTDGTLGLKAIKGEGGMVMAQACESAEYDGMPRSAIATGLVDYVLPPEQMPEALLAYAQRAFGRSPRSVGTPTPAIESALQRVCVVLRAQTGHDFTHYKPTTLHRRVSRRMAVTQIEHPDEYVRYLQGHPAEGERLLGDLLIGVTSFFRDPGAFEALATHAIPARLAAAGGQPVRVWVPACSTGEEAYSLAMLLQEVADSVPGVQFQVFATDLDAHAIAAARAGVYPESIAADVSPDRLARFFTQEDGAYRVRKSLRDLMVFATHNVLRDPPLSRLELISCRNLLIYLDAVVQKRLVPLFHYALNPDGYLLLGTSETIGDFPELFATVDSKWRLYQRRGAVAPGRPVGPFASPLPAPAAGRPASHLEARAPRGGIREVAEQALLEACAPACAVITAEADVLYIHGRTGRYLEPAPGEARMNLLHMAREGMRHELAAAVHKVATEHAPIRYDGLRVKTNGDVQIVNLVVQPLTRPAAARGLILVRFEDATPKSHPGAAALAPAPDAEQRIADLERELAAKGEYLQAIVEEMETANEELTSANEELQSGNEELQSTNEEMETSREELQSVNEELATVNTELSKKIEELGRANNDLNNLMAGTGIGTIFVDHHLLIQRFTPAATKIIHLIPTDVGRPVSDLVSRLAGAPRLVEDVQGVLDTLMPVDAEVQTREGQWYAMRIQPYRTVDNVIEGAVLTFVDMTPQKVLQDQLQQAARAAQEAQAYAETMLETLHEPVLILGGDLRVRAANPAYYAFFQVTAAETVGRLVDELGEGQWSVAGLRRALEEILPRQTRLAGFTVTHDFPRIGRRTLRLNARDVRHGTGAERVILLAMDEVTDA